MDVRAHSGPTAGQQRSRREASRARPARIPVGISSCLLGEAVRYDGGHKRDAWIVDTLGQWFEYRPVCPEVAIGLGVPRPPIRLEAAPHASDASDAPDAPRVKGIADLALDVTDALEALGREVAGDDELCGYIFKAGSPSCGMEGVPVHGPDGPRAARGRGAFARALMAARPGLPCSEEWQLGDPALRESFVRRVVVRHRWRQGVESGALDVAGFHERHRLVLMAHDPAACRRLGSMLADAGRTPPPRLAEAYLGGLMAALGRPAGREDHLGILRRLLRTIEANLTASERGELHECLEDYRRGRVGRAIPARLLRHHYRQAPQRSAAVDTYLEPWPAELQDRP